MAWSASSRSSADGECLAPGGDRGRSSRGAWKCAACRSAVAVAEPDSCRRCIANCRTGSSSRNRGSSSGAGTRSTSDWSTSAPSAGRTSASVAVARRRPDVVEREPAAEHREPGEEVDLLRLEEVHAPVEHGGHRAVAVGQVARAGAEAGVRRRAVCSSRVSRVDGESSRRPGGRELEGEGDAVEPAADRRQGGRVVLGDGGRATRRPRPGRGAARRRGRRPPSRGRRRRPGSPAGPSATSRSARTRSAGPARRHDDEVRAARDEVGQQRGRAGELLEVVEHQQDAQAGEVGDERVERAVRRAASGRPSARPRVGTTRAGSRTAARSTARAPPGNLRCLAVQQLHREPGLADPARPGDGHEPVAPERTRAISASRSASRPMSGVAERVVRGGAIGAAPGERMARGRHPPVVGRRWRGGGRCEPATCGTEVRRDPWHGIPAGDRGDQSGTFVVVEGEAVGEGTDGVRVGAPALAALEGADRLGGQAGSLGQLLLGQRPRLAQAAQHDGEVARRRTWIHGSDASPSDAGRVGASSRRAGVVPVWACCGWGGARRDAKVGRDGIRPPRREERP